MRRLSILSLLFSGLAFVSSARAQEMPPFAMPQIITQEEVENLSVDFDDAFNTIENPYLADTMKLNYQISLLEKMVTRQAALDRIAESYATLGMSFTPPPPPRGICAQLPPNGPCLAVYPDLYSDLVTSRKAFYRQLEVKAKDSEPGRKPGESDEAMIARHKKMAEEAAKRQEILSRKTRYQWTDINCLLGECRGVLVNSTNAALRYTVRAGTKLPDGTSVESVKPGDVRVSIDHEMIDVRPAPNTDTNAAAAAAVNPISSTLGASGVNVGGSSLEAMAASRAATANIIANAGGAPSAANAPSVATPVNNTPPPPGGAMPSAMQTAPAGAPAANSAPAGGTAAPAGNAAPLGPSGLF